MPTEKEIREIINLYDNGNGLSHGQIAKKLNYNQSTITRAINNFFKRNQDTEGNAYDASTHATHQCKTKNATNAKKTYDKARRIALNDRLFTRLEELITDAEISASNFKNFVISYGILEDKRSLLDTSQTGNDDDLLSKLVGALEDHAISTQTSGRIPGLPQDPANSDVRIGEERKD